MTRAQWNERVEKRQDVLGGDLWNVDTLRRRVFSRPEVAAIRGYDLMTGLWCDVDVLTDQGQARTIRVFA